MYFAFRVARTIRGMTLLSEVAPKTAVKAPGAPTKRLLPQELMPPPPAHTRTMDFKRPLLATLAATFLIAFGAMPAAAIAQNAPLSLPGKSSRGAAGSVVTTEQVRAELLAWAPEGVEP